MLLRDLKKVASESVFNPNKPDKGERILLDVGNPSYWITKATEKIMEAKTYAEGSAAYHVALTEATKLLILARAYMNDKAKKPKETRNRSTRKNHAVPKTS